MGPRCLDQMADSNLGNDCQEARWKGEGKFSRSSWWWWGQGKENYLWYPTASGSHCNANIAWLTEGHKHINNHRKRRRRRMVAGLYFIGFFFSCDCSLSSSPVARNGRNDALRRWHDMVKRSGQIYQNELRRKPVNRLWRHTHSHIDTSQLKESTFVPTYECEYVQSMYLMNK